MACQVTSLHAKLVQTTQDKTAQPFSNLERLLSSRIYVVQTVNIHRRFERPFCVHTPKNWGSWFLCNVKILHHNQKTPNFVLTTVRTSDLWATTTKLVISLDFLFVGYLKKIRYILTDARTHARTHTHRGSFRVTQHATNVKSDLSKKFESIINVIN